MGRHAASARATDRAVGLAPVLPGGGIRHGPGARGQRLGRNTTMASRQSEAVRELYAGWTRARLNGEEQDNEHWGDLTRDPGGVDYIETGAGGVPAMWAIPKDAAEDRVLLCIHGGGVIGGPLYTPPQLVRPPAHPARPPPPDLHHPPPRAPGPAGRRPHGLPLAARPADQPRPHRVHR